jgi:hypothetical protein
MYYTKPRGSTFHKTAVLVFTAVRNSNLTKYLFCFELQENNFWFCLWNFKEIGVVNGYEFERNNLMCERNLFTLCCCVYGFPPLCRHLCVEEASLCRPSWFDSLAASLNFDIEIFQLVWGSVWVGHYSEHVCITCIIWGVWSVNSVSHAI